MGYTYQEFNSSPGNLTTDLKTKMAISSDWTNPSAQLMVMQTSGQPVMAIDLVGGGAVGLYNLRPKFYRLYSGGVASDGIQRSLWWSRNGAAGGAITTATTLRCRLAAGPGLFYLDIEGPRAGETGADNTSYGSFRQCLFMNTLARYNPTFDTTNCFVVGGSASTPGNDTYSPGWPASYTTNTSRTQADDASWVSGRLISMGALGAASTQAGSPYVMTHNPFSGDGSVYEYPWQLVEDSYGPRGRLNDIVAAGWSSYDDSMVTKQLSDGQDVTIGGNAYRVLAPYKTDGSSNANSWGSFGPLFNNQGSRQAISQLIAVRKA